MRLETKLLGEVEVQESDIISFDQGLLGLQDFKNFTLLPIEQDIPFVLLQSLDDTEVSFVLAYPYAFKSDYAFDISDEDRELLKIQAPEQVLTYAIVTMNDSWATSTMNLLAPVVIKMKEKIAKQIVLQNSEAYSLRHPIGTSEGSVK